MADKKVYIGKGNKKSDTWIKATISEKGIQELQNNLESFKDAKYAKININILKEPNQYGKDVEITLDLWKPDSQKNQMPENEDIGF